MCHPAQRIAHTPPCFVICNGQSTATSKRVPGGPLVGQAAQGYSNLRALRYNAYKERTFCINLFFALRTNILTCPLLYSPYLSRTGQLDNFCKDQTVTQILAT